MSLDLKDIRAKVPAEVWAVIKGVSVAQRRPEGEIVRDVLTKWAEETLHAATVAERLLQVEGISGQNRDWAEIRRRT